MRKLFFITLFTFGLFSFSTVTSAAMLFKDVSPNHYAFDAIKWAKQFEVIGGYEDGTFKPNQAVSEQQFARILAHYFDLEEIDDELEKFTEVEKASDTTYNTLAAYGVPLNGYFHNTIRGQAVTRGIVAQAISYVADGQTNLDGAITFLLDSYISTGQNPKYEDRNLAKYFGSENTLTRAQAVTLFYRLSDKNYFYLSEAAQQTYENLDHVSLVTRAKEARKRVDANLRIGNDYSSEALKENWDGLYTFSQRYGKRDFDLRGIELKITNTTKTTFDVEINTYDGMNSSFVEGTATLLTDKKGMLSESMNDNRCVVEFQKLDHAIKIMELDCAKERDGELSYSGTVRRK